MSQELDAALDIISHPHTFTDINGDRLFIGTLVTSSQFQGQGEVVGCLIPDRGLDPTGRLEPDDGRFGALLRIKVLPRISRSNAARGGQIVDMRVKLGGITRVPPPADPKERTTDQKYGI